jgi:hypothetical protein
MGRYLEVDNTSVLSQIDNVGRVGGVSRDDRDASSSIASAPRGAKRQHVIEDLKRQLAGVDERKYRKTLCLPVTRRLKRSEGHSAKGIQYWFIARSASLIVASLASPE